MKLEDVLVEIKCRNADELKSFMESMNKCAVYNLIVDFSGKELSDLIGNSINIAKVTFTDKVKTLKDFSLECCDNVVWVQLPKSLKSIGDYSFYGCESLKDIDIPNSVESIGVGAFTGCISFKELNLPKSLKSISSNLVDDCRKLSIIRIPKCSEDKNFSMNNNLLLGSKAIGCKKLKTIKYLDKTIEL